MQPRPRSPRRFEVVVGLLVGAGAAAAAAALAAWAIAHLISAGTYDVSANFASAGGLQPGAPVQIAGVPVGRVASTSLRDDAAHVVLELRRSVRLPADSAASIRSQGLVGETYVSIEPGHGTAMLTPGDRIRHTVPATDLEDAIAAHLFGKVS
jgi:phospholipid/cholesterol/gamma-HCH transport system substrate-binding protein